MKKILINGLVMASLALGSCQQFLDIRQPDVTPYDKALNDVNNVEALMRTTYNDLQGYNNFVRSSTMFGDEVDISRQSQDQFGADYITRNFGRFNGIGEGLWSVGYSGIFRSNQIIKATLANEYTTSAPIRSRLLGEAYFIRGYMHFELCRQFALPYSAGKTNPGVVIRTVAPAFADEVQVVPRATLEATYGQAIADIKASLDLLPETPANGRLGKDAARAALARIYFNMVEDGSSANYQEAKTYCDQLVQSGKYKVTLPMNTFSFDISRRGIIKADTGIVFELTNTLSDDAGGSLAGAFWGNTADNVFTPILTGSGSLLVALRNFGGLRYDTLVLNRDGARPYTAKYAGGTGIPFKNTPVFRYAEVLLTRAEANLQAGGDVPTSLADLNAVQAAARAPLTTTTDRDQLLDAIRLERRVELHLEGDRYHELRRLKSTNIRGASYNDSKSFFQIPNSEQRANPTIVLN
jgi:hypothetical protein